MLEELEQQRFCVFVEWTSTEGNICSHCIRLESGIVIDMYRHTLAQVPFREKQDMLELLYKMYPLYSQIYNWLEDL